MPDDPSTMVATPTNPVEAGLADLWARTAGPMTPFSRNGFRKAVEDMLESWLWELSNQIQNRVPDPVDYVEMRRKTFGSDLTMSLSRMAQGDSIPAALFRTRPMRAIDSTVANYASFTNDVFSYQKEIEYEGELNNIVLVVQYFLEIPAEEAVLVVNKLMTARMEQFEYIVATELPALFEDFKLDKAVQEKVLGYVKRLQRYMAGVLRWHFAVDRYKEFELRKTPKPGRLYGAPTGIGTSAARLSALFNVKRPAPPALPEPRSQEPMGNSASRVAALFGAKQPAPPAEPEVKSPEAVTSYLPKGASRPRESWALNWREKH